MIVKKFVLLGALIGALASAHTASAQSATGASARDANSAARTTHNPPTYRAAHNPPTCLSACAQGVPPDPYAVPPDPNAVPPDPYKCLLADAFAKVMGQKSSCQ
ncbi:hypothetical protein [Massilia glaciei]|uniref:Uncharacterized protein n=1 Tax=Massilia glaciei TaxID=1524097 RepID=A0A2U2I6S6_9BURK|nr:hypothetical protein [Massilia glaciei]PWF55474.1 hypothetical protein C7C56_001630 [Massilia glaciei]